jgi:hypothetical protein
MSNVLEPDEPGVVMGPEDYFWRVVERDVDEFIYRGGSDREAQNRALAGHYDVPAMAVRVAWIDARRMRRQEWGIGA